jgi:RimJ/RimL family protein N-acetyltransferase
VKERFASERLVMRPHEAGDAAALHAGYGDAELMRWWSTPPHASVDETRAYLVGEDDAEEPDDDEEQEGEDAWQGWTVTLDGEPVGTLSAGRRRKGVVEIGYLLVRRHWGRGIGREMVGCLVRLLFEEEGARRLYADVDPDNAASVALLEGLGFRLEGRLRQSWDSHIGIRDSLIFGLLADEWRAGPPAAIDPAVAKTRATALLVRPIRLAGLGLAVFGLVLAIVPRVPRLVAGLVLALAFVQLAVATVLRRRAG